MLTFGGFRVLTKHEQWGERVFNALILKSAVASNEEAGNLLGPPLELLKAVLDTGDDEGLDMFWPDISRRLDRHVCGLTPNHRT